MLYTKTFDSFIEGLKELRGCVLAADQSIERALVFAPPPNIMISVADLTWLPEAYTMFVLMHQAYKTQKDQRLQDVFAKATQKGFTYRTRSRFVFGWRRFGKKQVYRFFVNLPTTPCLSVEVIESSTKLEESGWKELKRKEIICYDLVDVNTLGN